MTIEKSNTIIKNRNLLIKILFTLVFLGNGDSFAGERNNIYTLHPPRLSVPSGAPGEVRRVITQFHNWTLICDEQQSLKQGICNVTQTVRDQEDNTIFSWSLVATKNGQAVMLFRTLPQADTSVPIKMVVDDVSKTILIDYTQCNQTVCLAQSLVEPILSQYIEQGKNVRISYKIKGGGVLSFVVSFKGLSEALYSLQR
ncbi:invasion associated locus B family protein [Bartonella sp. B10]